jgi:hypothetical protein
LVVLGLVLLIIGGAMWWRVSHPQETTPVDDVHNASRRRFIAGFVAAGGVASLTIALPEWSA